jgi:hypothetical protein
MHDQQNIKTTVFVFKSGTYKNQFALKMVGGGGGGVGDFCYLF